MFKKLPSDPFFDAISHEEMMWMCAQIDLDNQESLDTKKAYIEYLASFINPQGVQEARAMANNTIRVSDEDFQKTLDLLEKGLL